MGMRRTPCGYFAPRNDRNGLIDTQKSPDFLRNQDFFALLRPLISEVQNALDRIGLFMIDFKYREVYHK